MSTYYVESLTAEQKADLKQKFRSADWEAMSPGWNITFHSPEHEDSFVEWCEDNNVKSELV